ncbi:MAG: undecaprenyldiphospho-muramoylpentapeptide beta-N-acetylglucosaminyltransferase [Verrucomicrobiae bacterium]|nr:undecaprenyldiphospho-muramoylpentapeptide beta-N-acetylglucosaminyltransferase [Verrucomicrobiae bacterium]
MATETPSGPSASESLSTISGKRLVVACGGTGGHLFPGIAVAEEWRARGGEALLIISEKQIDTLATEGYGHLRFERQQSIAMPRLLSPKMIGFGIGFLKGLAHSRKLIKAFNADAVLGMGGFTSTAPLVAGWMRGLPTFIHESNAIPGRANLLNARFSTRALVGFETCAKHFGKRQVSVVGTPLRPSLATIPDRATALAHFGLRPDRHTLLVMGGSQGARRLNELTAQALEKLPAESVQVLHISGPQDFGLVKPAHENAPADLTTTVIPFCAEMQMALAAADLVVCRSGASTLTELAAYGLPAVLVPYPFAAHDHQTRNAEGFAEAGAARLWPQDELDEETFADRLVALLEDETELQWMGIAMKAFATPGASGAICDLIGQSILAGRGD